jgi:hypothetical protein
MKLRPLAPAILAGSLAFAAPAWGCVTPQETIP